MPSPEQVSILREFETVLPQPVAEAAGRIARARSLQEEIDCALRAGEILSRYLAAVGLSSLAARESWKTTLPLPDGFDGKISFGPMATLCQNIGLWGAEHPLREAFQAAFGKDRGQDRPGRTGLSALIQLRNRLGHGFSALEDGKAQTVMLDDRPTAHFITVVKEAAPLLELPLFIIEDQQLKSGKQIYARRLLLMGDAEPQPEQIKITGGINELNTPYVACADGILLLLPFLLWDHLRKREKYGILLLNGINVQGGKVNYRSLYDDDSFRQMLPQVDKLLHGELRGIEECALADGQSLLESWREKRGIRVAKGQFEGGAIRWGELDDAAVRRYAKRLRTVSGENGSDRALISRLLFDERETLTAGELRQVELLFGTEDRVRHLLNRNMLDCRATRRNSDQRWEEREETTENILVSLERAIAFFSRHVSTAKKTELNELSETTGTADYIAMREGLVNLFIHQDYAVQGMPAQIEIREDRAIFFNAGFSLAGDKALVEGGKSTARNPVIARALRLIGFAELAGSGLSALHLAWRKARRRPPKLESNESANTFTLTLDWREVPEDVNAFWKKKLGVKVSEEQAGILSLLSDGAEYSLAEVASASGIYLDDAQSDLRFLKRQGLAGEEDDLWSLAPHLMDLLAGDGGKGE
jgi:hypothetical protein